MNFEALKEQHGEDAVKEAFMLGAIQVIKQALEWQPIETAPDREYILILVEGQITGVGSTYLGDWWASMPNGEVCELNEPPTHWMPLPQPPEEQ